jgi:anti-sigma factor RsiW
MERIPWYLNGTLDEAETAEVETLLAQSAEGRAELAEARAAASIYGHRLPSEVLVAYAIDGKHEAFPSELIERYLAVSPVAGEELRMVRESLAELAADATEREDAVLPFRRPEAPAPAGWKRLALAASILGIVGLGLAAWQWSELESRENRLAEVEQQLRDALAAEAVPAPSGAESDRIETLEEANLELAAGKSDLVEQVERQQERIRALGEQVADLSQPLLNVPVVDVFPGDMTLRGELEPARRVVVPLQTKTVTLILNSRLQADQGVTALRILDAEGKRRWASESRPQRDELGVFTVGIPVQSLGAGVFTLELVAQEGGETRIVETYLVEIK